MELTETLKARAEIIRKIRGYFDEQGFIEVTTPVMIAAPAPEAHIDCPACGSKFLRASPELQMKKLLAAGMDKIYQIGPCFREGEFGVRHNPEFTMIEWYRLNADYRDIYRDTLGLLSNLSNISNVSAITVRDAYRKFAGWDPWTEWNQDRFDYDMATKIEPNLGEGFVSLWDYPPQAASLARCTKHEARDTLYAERWELYLNGVELANCFTELCDGPEQRRRFLATKEERKTLGEADYPIDEEFLEMVPLMKSASGVALGVDRLVTALCGGKDIHEFMVGE